MCAGNLLNNPWLDYTNFISGAELEGFFVGDTMGTGVIQTVTIQLSPLGRVANQVTVKGCLFKGKTQLRRPAGSVLVVAGRGVTVDGLLSRCNWHGGEGAEDDEDLPG